MSTRLGTFLIAIGATLALVQGCATPVRQEAVPAALTAQAVVPGVDSYLCLYHFTIGIEYPL